MIHVAALLSVLFNENTTSLLKTVISSAGKHEFPGDATGKV